MKFVFVSMIAAAGMMVAGSALAIDLPAAGKARCGACHSVDKRLVGPAFQEVSAKYKGDKDAVKKIIASVNKGGSFGWKLGMMPPKGLGASDAEIKTMAEFIAGLAK